MSTFDNVTLEQFKQGVADFCKAADSGNWTEEQLDNGLKAVHLMYLGMVPQNAGEQAIAVSYLEYAQSRHRKAVFGDPIGDLRKAMDRLLALVESKEA